MMWKKFENGVVAKLLSRKWHSLSKKRKKQIKAVLVALAVILAGLVITASYASLFSNSKSAKTSSKDKSHDSSADKGKDKKSDDKNSNASKPVQPPGPSSQSQEVPSSLLDLSSWKLTLPVAASGANSPQEITQPELNTYTQAPYFQLANGGVQFQAPVSGVTTKNSKYPRSELREMTSDGQDEASWSNTSGTHSMTIRQAITHLPAVKSELVAGQIHDDSKYIILIRLEGSNLFVEGNGKNVGTLNSNYRLGTVFTVQIVASDGHIRVLYDGAQKADYTRSGSGYYFKAGCYAQSNPSRGDDPADYGQVVIYDLRLSHT